MITGSLISIVITLLVIGLLFALVYWVLGILKVPQPIYNIIVVIMVVIMALYLISLLAGLGGHPLLRY